MSKIDLSTSYLGLKLKNTIVPSASPLSKDIDNIKKMEDAGAAAVVLHSLFEEQITHDALELFHYTTSNTESYAEALSYFPDSSNYKLGPEEYLEHIRKAKDAVEIPVIASLNGSTPGGWTEYAGLMEEAGADALELNVYLLAADSKLNSADIENIYLNTLNMVKSAVKIPVAMKISPYISAMSNFARNLDLNGVNGLVLFNRFYQPDINLETLDVVPNILLSNQQSMRLPLRWIAILYGRIKADLAATSGINTAGDVIKMIMAGAKVTQMFAALHRNRIEHIKTVLQHQEQWMVEHEYESVEMMRGSMSYKYVANPGSYERANYMRALNSFE